MASDIVFDEKTFLERTCRTCGRYIENNVEDSLFQPMFIKTGGDNLENEQQHAENEQLKHIFIEFDIWNLNIKANDGLPQLICNDCVDRFQSVRLFREECLETQIALNAYYSRFIATVATTDEIGKLTPKLCRSSSSSPSFNPEDLVEEVPESPDRIQQLSPLGSPKISNSKLEDICSDHSLGTPPPIYEEFKTEPIDMQTMDFMKSENELTELQQLSEIKKNPDDITVRTVEETISSFYKYTGRISDDGDESSTPSTENEESDHEGEFNSNLRSETVHCEICLKTFSNQSLLKNHMMDAHSKDKPFICIICANSFKTKFQLSQHKLKHNRPDSLLCELCRKYFRSQLHLQRHTKNFHLTSTYTCHICNEKFENYTQIRFQYHLRQHGDKRFQCQNCDKSFHQKIHLKNHERTHTKEKPFRCNICGKAYRQEIDCQEHMLTHRDSTPFKCNICNKGFSQRSTLRIHYRKHEGDDSYHCELCGKTFLQKSHFEMHQLTNHANVKKDCYTDAIEDNYICEHCDASFSTQLSLSVHMKKRHSRHRSNLCGYCGKVFTSESLLKAHMRAHANPLNAIKCQHCNKLFPNKQMLSIHEQQHKESQHFQCNFCSKTFLYRSAYGEHMLTHLESENGDEDDFMDFNLRTTI